jgi:hypothetical protein
LPLTQTCCYGPLGGTLIAVKLWCAWVTWRNNSQQLGTLHTTN